MATFLNQPDGSDACCEPCVRAGPCEDCDTATIDSATCESITNSATLVGYSKYTDWNSGDWNTRKYRRRTLTGQAYECTWTNSSCSGTRYSTVENSRDYNGHYCQYDPVTTSVSNGNPVKFGLSMLGLPCEWPGADTTEPGGQPYCSGTTGNILRAAPDTGYTTSKSETVWTDTGTGACFFSHSTFYKQRHGNWTATLSDPDTLADAFARAGGSTLGTSCTTSAGTIGSTTEGSTSSISVTSTRTVQVTLELSGLTASSDYDVTIELSKYNTGTMATTTEYDVVTYTATGTTDTWVYDVPVEGGYEYTYVGATISPA